MRGGKIAGDGSGRMQAGLRPGAGGRVRDARAPQYPTRLTVFTSSTSFGPSSCSSRSFGSEKE